MMHEKSSTLLFEEKGYDKDSPFLSTIIQRYCINKPQSTKQTWHIALDISDSHIRYRPGDSIGICPQNDLQEVLRVLESLGYTGDEEVTKAGSERLCLLEFLLKKANLAFPTKKLLRELAACGAVCFVPLLEPDKSDECRVFLQKHTVWELLQQCSEIRLDVQLFVELLSPLLPRFYSIASSQSVHPNEVHLLVSKISYEVEGKKRVGVCSDFLCQRTKVADDAVGIYLQKTRDFLLPNENHTPIVMIGPGTGVAPFRAFLQQRCEQGFSTDKNWLFFGERQKAFDFIYEEYWTDLQTKGVLRLNTAFSRDQKEKVYVQDTMWQERKELFKWLSEGAILYVCGDASRMAKDVEAMLQQIISSEGQMPPDEAKAYLSSLRKQKRYLRDVY